MKLMMVAGGLLGFVVGLSLAMLRDATWSTALTRAAAGAVAVGWLFRWWSHLWLRSLHQANYQRWQKAKLEAEQADAAENPELQKAASTTTAGPTHQP